MSPLLFWRQLLCLRGYKRLEPEPCPEPAQMDDYSHHPIAGPVGSRPYDRDSLVVSNLHQLNRTVGAAKRLNRIGPDVGQHLWVTEYWWETDPPDHVFGYSLREQANWIQEALYSFWKDKAEGAVLLQLRDSPYTLPTAGSSWQTGVFFDDQTPKPSFTAARFPFVAERLTKRWIRVWTKVPASGSLRIRNRAGGRWHHLVSGQVVEGQIFHRRVVLSRDDRLRALVAGERSLVWDQR
jgi:hypothetical protein